MKVTLDTQEPCEFPAALLMLHGTDQEHNSRMKTGRQREM